MRWLFILLCFVSSSIVQAQPVLEKMDLFESGKGGYGLYRIPGMVVTKKGTILVYAEARKTGKTDWDAIDIWLRRSTDGGKTWEAARQINQRPKEVQKNPAALKQKLGNLNEITFNNPVAIVDSTMDRIHFLYCVEYNRCFYLFSEDDGKSFSQPVEITSTLEAFQTDYKWVVLATGPGHGISLRKSGKLVVPVWLSTGEGGHAHRPSCVSYICSEDHGKTWQRGPILVNHPTLKNPSETVAVELTNGDWLFNIRHEGEPHLRAICTSSDGGKTWSKPHLHTDLPETVCMGSLTRSSHPKQADLLFANPHNPGRRERKNLMLKLSEDEGKTWPIQKVLDPGMAGYSDVAFAPDGSIYCIYERGSLAKNAFQTKFLTFVKCNREWLTQKND